MQCDSFFIFHSSSIQRVKQIIRCCYLPLFSPRCHRKESLSPLWHHPGVMHINYSNIWLKNATKVNWIYIVIYDRKIYFPKVGKKCLNFSSTQLDVSTMKWVNVAEGWESSVNVGESYTDGDKEITFLLRGHFWRREGDWRRERERKRRRLKLMQGIETAGIWWRTEGVWRWKLIYSKSSLSWVRI